MEIAAQASVVRETAGATTHFLRREVRVAAMAISSP
jgi:hypothetical protein